MFKHSKWIVSIIAVVLFISGFQFVSDATVVDGEKYTDAKVHQFKEDHNYKKVDDEHFQRLYMKLLDKCNIKIDRFEKKYDKQKKYDKRKHYYKKKQEVNKPVEQEQPKEEEQDPVTPEQPNEEPVTPEQPKEEPVTPEEPKEQPKEEPVTPTKQEEEQVEENKEENKQEDPALFELNQFEQQVFQLTNEARANNGLQPLQIDIELSKVAREKSRDMAVNRYFSHTSPVYGSPFDMMRAYGISYRTAGENIAQGQRTPQEVVNAWMNSPGHRANILNSSFTHIGIGYVADGNHWTQQFIGK